MLRLLNGIMATALFAITAFSPSTLAAPCAGFSDVEDTDYFCPNVTWIKNRYVTLGCGPGLYCPSQPVTRLAMAAFLNRLGDATLPPNVIWVANTGGGFQSIESAFNYVAPLAMQGAPFLILLAPGLYTVITQYGATVPSNVRVRGSGIGSTIIQGRITLWDKSSLSDVTVRTHIANSQQGTTHLGLFGTTSLDNVRLEYTCDFGCTQIAHLPSGTNLTLDRVNLVATASSSSLGFISLGGDASVTIRDSTIQLNTSPSYGSMALYATQAAKIEVVNSTIEMTGDQGSAVIVADSASALISRTRLIGGVSGGDARNQAKLQVEHSTFTALNYGLRLDPTADVRAAHSQFYGPIQTGARCIGVYDRNFAAVSC